MKATEGLQDGSASICEIINLIKIMKVGVFIGHIEGHSKGKVTMKDNPGRFLIKKYNSAAKETRVRARHLITSK